MALPIPPLLVALGTTATLPAGATIDGHGKQVAILLEGELDGAECRGALVTGQARTAVTLLVLAASELASAAVDADVAAWLRAQRS